MSIVDYSKQMVFLWPVGVCTCATGRCGREERRTTHSSYVCNSVERLEGWR